MSEIKVSKRLPLLAQRASVRRAERPAVKDERDAMVENKNFSILEAMVYAENNIRLEVHSHDSIHPR